MNYLPLQRHTQQANDHIVGKSFHLQVLQFLLAIEREVVECGCTTFEHIAKDARTVEVN